jgi:AraC family transcriptional regulator
MGLVDIAAGCGTHPVTISRQFRRYFGCSLGEYRRRLMIRRSLPLIGESAIALGTIAFTCGFADQSHFIRTFRGATRFRPGEYRQL